MKIEEKQNAPGRIVAEISGGMTLNGDPVTLLITDNPLSITAKIKDRFVSVKMIDVAEELCREYLKVKA